MTIIKNCDIEKEKMNKTKIIFTDYYKKMFIILIKGY